MSYAPFILAPPLTSCDSAYLVFGQGTAPYTIYPIHTGDANGTSLETLPRQTAAGVYQWNVDFNAGANLTFVLSDATGTKAYSDFRVVQANGQGPAFQCPKNAPLGSSLSSASKAGAIAGGVIGALVVVALILVTVWWVRRRSSNPSPPASIYGRSRVDDEVAANAALGSSSAGVRRAGTFNLPGVQLHPDSLVELRALDPPPNYGLPTGEQIPPKRRIGAWRRAVAAAGIGSAAVGTSDQPAVVSASGREVREIDEIDEALQATPTLPAAGEENTDEVEHAAVGERTATVANTADTAEFQSFEDGSSVKESVAEEAEVHTPTVDKPNPQH